VCWNDDDDDLPRFLSPSKRDHSQWGGRDIEDGRGFGALGREINQSHPKAELGHEKTTTYSDLSRGDLHVINRVGWLPSEKREGIRRE
jgi:hypothetical protein